MILVFQRHNVGDMDFPSLVDISDRHMALRKVRCLFNSESSSPCIPLFGKSSIIYEYFRHRVFRFFLSSITFFLQRNFHMLVIHDLVVHLVSGLKLLENRYPDQYMSSLCNSTESFRYCPMIQ